MSEPSVNQIPDHVQPSHALLAEIPGTTVEVVAAALQEADVDGGDISFLIGADGLAAYEARGNWFSRHMDETEDEVAGALGRGDLVAVVHCEDNDTAARIRRVLAHQGAETIHHFGAYTFD